MSSRLRIVLASVLAVAALGAIAPAANAYVYWSTFGFPTLSRANTDGSAMQDQTFITGLPTNLVSYLASDAGHLYWADNSGGRIARSNIDGTGVESNFITAFQPYGVAVDSGHVFWGSYNLGYIGRANLDGSNPMATFVTTSSGIMDVAVDSGHIYWTNYSTPSIFRANLDGTGVNASFITGVTDLRGITVDAGHIYWGDLGGSIGRANLDGTGVESNFIDVPGGAAGVVTDSKYIYWASYQGNVIGRARLDGTGVEENFISGIIHPWGITVDSRPIPTIAKAGKPTKSTLKVKVGCGDAAACSLKLTGKKVGGRGAVTPKTVTVGAGRTASVKLSCSKALRRSLARGGRVAVTATNPVSTGTKSVTLRVAR